jgi:hypothetical protein
MSYTALPCQIGFFTAKSVHCIRLQVHATSLLGKHQIHEQQKSQVRLARV